MDAPPARTVADAQRIVVKIGSRVLVDEHNRLDEDQVRALVDQLAAVRTDDREVIAVSSGAVAAGLVELGLDGRPTDLPSLQAAAAIGQAALMTIYRRCFAVHGIAAAQVLVTHDDLRHRERHLNTRNTLHRLLAGGVVPIVNENDTVAVEEIRFGDNDELSALLAMLVRADVLIMLTTAEGLLDRPPGEAGQLIDMIPEVTPETHAMASDTATGVGRGGMRSKVLAAEMVTRAGELCVIANGREPRILERLLDGASLGTLFVPRPERMAGRKRWIAFFDHPRGDLWVDAGAARAVRAQGRSLLAAGITRVDGRFERGAPVRILDPEGTVIARGLVNYPHDELERIRGRRSDEIESVLGRCEYREVVHRDNLAVT